MASSSPLSYQTTMPEYPDVSYQTWANLYGMGAENRAHQAINAWISGNPDYNTWRTNLLDKYNASLSAYNTWLSTGAGQRASAESGNYNPSYFQGAGNPSASPLSYQDVRDSSGFSDMAQGISGIFQFAQALQSIRMATAQIAGQTLKNKSQEIQNQFLEDYLLNRNRGTQFRSDYFAHQADRSQLQNEALFSRLFSKNPELWHGVDQSVFSPYNRGQYDLRGAQQGYDYQRQGWDLNLMRAAYNLRDSQNVLTKASTREKNWYIDNIMKFQKQILENSAGLLKGQLNFQKTEQDLRKAGIIAGIGVNVINAAVNAIKAFIPGINIAPSGQVRSSGGSSPFIDPFDLVDVYGGGL